MPHATVKPFRLRYRADVLGCDGLGGRGFFASCSCGWGGKIRRTYREARADRQQHATEHRA